MTHAPGWHYEQAEKLLADIAEGDTRPSALGRAHVHAILATVPLAVAVHHQPTPLPRRDNAHSPF